MHVGEIPDVELVTMLNKRCGACVLSVLSIFYEPVCGL